MKTKAAPRGAVRFESQRSRILLIIGGCFLISLTFLVSSRPEPRLFKPLKPSGDAVSRHRKAAGDAGIDVAIAGEILALDSAGGGSDFQVDVVQQGEKGEGRRAGAGAGAGEDGRQTEFQDAETKGFRHLIAREVDGAGETAADVDSLKPTIPLRLPADDGKTTPITADPGDRPAEKGINPTIIAAEMNNVSNAGDGIPTPEKTEEKIILPTLPIVKEEQPEQATAIAAAAGVLCDDTDFRSHICDMHGDIRIHPNSSTVTFVGAAAPPDQHHKVRPYPRKGDELCMTRITELTVQTSNGAPPPACTKTHAVPAVVFSTGGYTGNIFHDFSDVIVPLFTTANRYAGEVQFIMLNHDSWWLVKYDRVVRALSHYPPIDFNAAAAAGEVHCFPHAVVSLNAHKELIIEQSRSPDNYSSLDFTAFIRSTFLLPRDAPAKLGELAGKKPRLLIISRRRTRLLTNLPDVTRLAEELGFEVVVNEADVANDLVGVGKVINSADVMVGVHGAGLTNMMFLPPGATMVQIVPWGGLEWIAMMDYGEPAIAMGLKYIQYSIAVGESSLAGKYPPEHEIFTNPTGLHKRGFGFIKETLMDGQDITIDVTKFRGVLLQALQNLMQ